MNPAVPAHKLIQPRSVLVPGSNRSPGSQALAMPSRVCFQPGKEHPPAIKQRYFARGLDQPEAPTPEFSTLCCQELYLSNLESWMKCQTIAFPLWKDLGRREERNGVEMQASRFYTRKSMLPGGQKTGCKNMLTSYVFSLEAIAAPIKY